MATITSPALLALEGAAVEGNLVIAAFSERDLKARSVTVPPFSLILSLRMCLKSGRFLRTLLSLAYSRTLFGMA
jgi:hypothetical protein